MKDFIQALLLTIAIAIALIMADYLAYGDSMTQLYKANNEH